MVFSRKHDPIPVKDEAVTDIRRTDRSVLAHASHAAANVPAESVIGKDLSIEGQAITIRCKGSLRVNGDIQADLHSKSLEIGREAQINGAIAADTVNVYGTVQGAILGERVILHATANVEGDIHSGNLAIESGASFDGCSRKVKDLQEVRPQLDKAGSGRSDPAYEQHASHTGDGESPSFGERPPSLPSRLHS